MVLQVGTGVRSYKTNGVTRDFGAPRFIIDEHLTVLEVDALGNDIELLRDVDWIASGGESQATAKITTTEIRPDGRDLYIFRIVPLDQQSEYSESGPFPAKTLETDLDKIWMALQQLSRVLDRAFKWSAVGNSGSVELPSNLTGPVLIGLDGSNNLKGYALSEVGGGGDGSNDNGDDVSSGPSDPTLIASLNTGNVDQSRALQDLLDERAAAGQRVSKVVSPTGQPLQIDANVRVPSGHCLDLSAIDLRRGARAEISMQGSVAYLPEAGTGRFRLAADASEDAIVLAIDDSRGAADFALFAVGQEVVMWYGKDAAGDALYRYDGRIIGIDAGAKTINVDPGLSQAVGVVEANSAFGGDVETLLAIVQRMELGSDIVEGRRDFVLAPDQSFALAPGDMIMMITDEIAANVAGESTQPTHVEMSIVDKLVDEAGLTWADGTDFADGTTWLENVQGQVTVTLDRPIARDFRVSAGARVIKIDPLKDATVIGPKSVTTVEAAPEGSGSSRYNLVKITYGLRCTARGCVLDEDGAQYGARGAAVRDDRSIGSRLIDCARVSPVHHGSGDGYGVHLQRGSTDAVVIRPRTKQCRHGITLSAVTRANLVGHQSDDDRLNAFDLHGGGSKGVRYWDYHIKAGQSLASGTSNKQGITLGSTFHNGTDESIWIGPGTIEGFLNFPNGDGTSYGAGIVIYPPSANVLLDQIEFVNCDDAVQLKDEEGLSFGQITMRNCRGRLIAGNAIDRTRTSVASGQVDSYGWVDDGTPAAVVSPSGSVNVAVYPWGSEGLPVGGATGQVLTKSSGDDFAAEWVTPSSGGAATFLGLSDSPTAYTDNQGNFVRVKADGSGLDFAPVIPGVSSFVGLSDVPNSFAEQAGRVVQVAPEEDRLIFAPIAAASGQLNQNTTIVNSYSDQNVTLTAPDLLTADGRTKLIQVLSTSTERFVNLPRMTALGDGAAGVEYMVRFIVFGSGSLTFRIDPNIVNPSTVAVLVPVNGTSLTLAPQNGIAASGTLTVIHDPASGFTTYRLHGGSS